MDELLELMAGAVAALIAAGILLGISAYAGVVLLPLVALAVLPCAVIGMFAGATLGGLVRTAIIVAGVVVSFAADWQRGLFPHLSSLLPFAPIALGIATIAALWRGIRVGWLAHIGYHGDVPATLDCHIGSGWFCLAGAVGWLAIVGEYATLGYGILFPRDLPWPLLPALVVALSTVALAGFSYATARNVAWGRHLSHHYYRERHPAESAVRASSNGVAVPSGRDLANAFVHSTREFSAPPPEYVSKHHTHRLQKLRQQIEEEQRVANAVIANERAKAMAQALKQQSAARSRGLWRKSNG